MADFIVNAGSSTVLGASDVAYINGFASSKSFKIKYDSENGVIVLTSKSKTNLGTFEFQAVPGSKLAFLNGAVTVGSNGKISFSKKNIDAALNSQESFNVVAPAAFTLTTNLDTWTGSKANETIVASDVLLGLTDAGVAVYANALSAGDEINAGAGADTLVVTSATALTVPTTATLTGIETITLKSAAGITSNTSGSNVTGTNTVNTTGVGAQTITGSATQDLNVRGTATGAIAVDGGKTVAVTATGTTVAGTIAVGAATAAAGAVTVKSTGSSVDTTVQGTIGVTGGTTVSVEQVAGNAVNTTTTAGAVTVTGNANTTTVTVKDTAAATAAAAVVGRVNGAVTINDVNAASNTAAGKIATVSLENFAAATVNSGALTTLNLKGTGTSVNAGTLGALTTAANTALALNVSGLTTTGTVTIDTDIKTLNLASTGTASTVNLLTNGATALNISGDAKVTLTGQTALANQVITVTNTAGAVLGTELATTATFTGGNGADSVLVGATTKTISMGNGDDTVTISAAPGALGSIAGGSGTDTIVANTNASSLAANTAITGFETLRVAGAAAEGAHVATGFTALELGATAGVSSFTNVAAGVGLTVLAAPNAGGHTVTLANATGTSDVFSLRLSNATNAAQAAGSITLAAIETVNITTVDAGTAANAAATVDTLTLVATGAKTVTVAGNNGLNLTNTGNVAITSFDASGVVADSAATVDTAANLAVTFTSANVTVGENISIKGGAGNDSLNVTGGAVTNDTILGGAGDDTIGYAGGLDVLTGGAGADTFDINAAGTSTAFVTITDLAKTDKIDLVGASTGTLVAITAANMAAAKVTLGAGATFTQYLNAAADQNGGTNATMEWFQFGGDTYVVVSNDDGTTGATAGYTSGTDTLVKITGLVDLSASALAAEVLTIA
jgi:S-layer protein